MIAKNQSAEPVMAESPTQQAQPLKNLPMYSNNCFHDTPVFQRSELASGQVVSGPAIIIEPTSTIVIEPEWQAQTSPEQNLILTRTMPLRQQNAMGTQADPVMLEIFNKLFMSIAEQMGFVLGCRKVTFRLS